MYRNLEENTLNCSVIFCFVCTFAESFEERMEQGRQRLEAARAEMEELIEILFSTQ